MHALQLQHETALEFYARRTANATIFIAWVVGIFAVASLIIGIIVGVQLSHLSNAVNGAGSGAICQSQGGPLPNC